MKFPLQKWDNLNAFGIGVIFHYGSVVVHKDRNYLCLEFRQSPEMHIFVTKVFSMHDEDQIGKFFEVLSNGGEISERFTDVDCIICSDGLRSISLTFKDSSPQFNKQLGLIASLEQINEMIAVCATFKLE